jgi:hypothetical protein
MDDRISSAAYNPFNDYDIATARGMERLGEAEALAAARYASGQSFSSRLRLAVLQFALFGIIGAGFLIFT